MKKKYLLLILVLPVFLVGCSSNAKSDPVLIYTNGDEETVETFSKTLDDNGFEGQYEIMNFGSSELAAKLDAEQADTKADLLSFSQFHMETLNDKYQMFQKHGLDNSNVLEQYQSEYFMPNLGFTGTIFYNTELVANQNLPVPTSLKDLADPIYKGNISFPSLADSTTGWLMIQSILDNYELEEAQNIIAGIKDNANVHIESSGSSPLKKVETGEVAIGFGIKHQAQAKKESGAKIEIVDVAEGDYTLTESYALTSDNQKAKEMLDVLVNKGRTAMSEIFPTPLYKNEINNDQVFKTYPEKLTKDLLNEHIKIYEESNK